MNVRIIATLFLAATLLPITDSHAGPIEDLRRLDLNKSFEQAIPDNLVGGLFNQALTTLKEYIEIDGALPPGGPSRQWVGELRLKLFPQGKSHSQDHLTAEGSVRFSPDADQQEFTLRFKSFKQPPSPVPPLSDDVI